jgi:antitoxin component HigA of HigAB toxin-antitoxin module
MKDFTAQQREIVARKLGYDGPMQGFDEFISSNPALEMKYATIAGKFAERMAKGGLVKMKPKKYVDGGVVTDQQITDWWSNPVNQKLSDAEIATTMQQFKVSPEQFSKAIGANESTAADIANRFTAATTVAPVNANASFSAAAKDVASANAVPNANASFSAAAKDVNAINIAAAPASAGLTWSLNNGITKEQYDANLVSAYKTAVTQGLSDAAVRAEMDKYGVSAADLARATGSNLTAVQTRYDAADPAAIAAAKAAADKAAADAAAKAAADAAAKSAADAAAKAAADKATADAATAAAAAAVAAAKAAADKAAADAASATTAAQKAAAASAAAAAKAAADKAAADAAAALATQNAVNDTFRQAAAAAKAAADAAAKAAADAAASGAVTGGGSVTFAPVGGTPQAASASQITPSKIEAQDIQNISTANRAGAANTIVGTTPTTTAQAAEVKPVTAETMTASSGLADLTTALSKFLPASGTVSDAAKVTAQEQATTELAGAAGRAEQIGSAQTVNAPPERTISEAEKVAGSAVDQTAITAALAKNVAATGEVTADMTVQGQLTKLTKDFDAKNPPPWAAGALRSVTAEMAARGLGASSMAGAALVQAALEKALPIASADAAVYQQMASQNLSNRQQMAVLTAQQRATFLGQEFDQNFQTRVVNAARVADIANMNFNAKQQVALENARLAQSVDLANLNSRQAAFMAELAQTATLETVNLNNRQQAAVENAKAALQMDLTNLSYEQQTTVLKTQLTAQTILSDTAAENAAKQFNAASTNQTNQFFAGLTSQVNQFNTSQTNAMEQFKVDQSNSVKKFNADVQNQREQFNAQQRLVIDQSNAQWQREIATINTGAINTVNLSNAQLTQQMTLAEYNNEVQMYRDAVTHAWTSSENDANRSTTLAAAEISKSAQLAIADATIAAANATAVGSLAAKVIGNTSVTDLVKAGGSVLDWVLGG